MQGYLSAEYAASLGHIGESVHLQRAGTYLLQRPIPDSPLADAVGPYPILCCRDWSALASALETLDSLVSVAGVADPFGDHTPELLKAAFPHKVAPFKEHYYIDSASPTIGENHRRNIKKAQTAVSVEQRTPDADTWVRLYSNLASRHGISGFSDFPAESLERQLSVPGLVSFCAMKEGEVVGALLWYDQGEVAYYHLAAYSDLGYELRASFALFAASIEHFKGRAPMLSLGAGAGVTADANDGLNRFKSGWASGTRTAYFCGRIYDEQMYRQLTERAGTLDSVFFPAYRASAGAR